VYATNKSGQANAAGAESALNFSSDLFSSEPLLLEQFLPELWLLSVPAQGL
jgi:hypothetical protein